MLICSAVPNKAELIEGDHLGLVVPFLADIANGRYTLGASERRGALLRSLLGGLASLGLAHPRAKVDVHISPGISDYICLQRVLCWLVSWAAAAETWEVGFRCYDDSSGSAEPSGRQRSFAAGTHPVIFACSL